MERNLYGFYNLKTKNILMDGGAMTLKVDDRSILIWLNSLGISNRTIDKILQNFKDIREIWYCDNSEIINIQGVRKTVKDRIVENRVKSYIEDYFQKIDKNNISVITKIDGSYPEKLRHIYDSPNVLYYKGEKIKNDLSIAVVGSRKSTDYGRWACEKFTSELVDMGVTIISGLALGIDTIAHKTTLDNNGRTIAILGNGLDKVYPKRNADLYKEIGENGTLISEFAVGTPPLAYNFPQRNRIISGLVDGIIVVEAQEKSGSLITAHHALEQGKNVFAIPGNINSLFSQGTNQLIRDGARPLLSMEDIIEEIKELRDLFENANKKSIDYSNYSDTEVKIIKILEKGPIHGDELVYKLNIDISSINTILIGLELKGIINEGSNGVFMLK